MGAIGIVGRIIGGMLFGLLILLLIGLVAFWYQSSDVKPTKEDCLRQAFTPYQRARCLDRR